jgi:AhpD family alkylhydroperoxidase
MKPRTLSLVVVAVGWIGAGAARAETMEAASARADIKKTFGFVPGFLKQTPDLVLPGAWQEMKSLMLSPDTALSGKQKELVGLAVSAQIPCRYCIYAHTKFAKLNGASDAEIGEAVAMGALTRKWSTVINGLPYDEAKFKDEIKMLVSNVQKAAAAGTPPPAPMAVTTPAETHTQIKQSFGFVPEFLRRYPAAGVAGAWTEWRDLELNPKTALDGKQKCLIGLAVAAQIPCRFCVHADTEFAKLEGASDKELAEAVAMAGMARHWSTLLNGLQVDEPGFRRDIDRLVQGARKAMAASKTSASR